MKYTNQNTYHPCLYVFCGLPGSGKTTIARQLEQETSAIRFNVDEWVAALGINFWDDEFRHKIDRRLFKHGVNLLEHGQSIILEDGTWSRKERDELREIARILEATIEIHYFDLPFDELWRRLIIRNEAGAHGTVPISKALLKECWDKLERPDKVELALFNTCVVHT